MGSAAVPEEIKGHRFVELDSLRGLAAFIVILHHFIGLWEGSRQQWWIRALPINVFEAGGSAVVLFFTLSGFVLTLPYLRPRHSGYGTYLAKRFCRLYLPYAAALLIAVFVSMHVPSPVYIGFSWLDLTWNKPVTLHNVLYHLTGIGNFNTADFNGTYWTLILEMRVSFLMPFIAWCALRLRLFTGLAISLGITVGLTLLDPHIQHHLVTITIENACTFFNGSLLAANYHLVPDWWKRQKPLTKWSLLAISLALFGYASILNIPSWLVSMASLFAFVITTQNHTVRHWMHRPAILRSGTISYSVYLLHLTFLLFIVHVFWHKVPMMYFLVPFVIGTYVAAEVFHRVVELPSIRLGRWVEGKLKSNKSGPHEPGVGTLSSTSRSSSPPQP